VYNLKLKLGFYNVACQQKQNVEKFNIDNKFSPLGPPQNHSKRKIVNSFLQILKSILKTKMFLNNKIRCLIQMAVKTVWSYKIQIKGPS